MERFVRLANRLSDMDWGWWPFLYLRPPRDERMTTRRVALMALHFGPIVGVVLVALVLWRQPLLRPFIAPLSVGTMIGSALWFLLVYRLSFAYCWNVRAAALKGEAAGSGVVAGALTAVALVATLIAAVGLGAVVGYMGLFADPRSTRAPLDTPTLLAEGRAEGERWSPGHTQAECLVEGMRRDASCHHVACKLPIQAFVEVCLERATPTPGLCDDVPAPSDGDDDLRWREARCRRTHPGAVRACFSFIPLLQLHCAQHRPTRIGSSSTVASIEAPACHR